MSKPSDKKVKKKRARRKDYERRHNINKHTPSHFVEEKRVIKSPKLDDKGEKMTDGEGNVIMVETEKTITVRKKKELKQKHKRDGKEYGVVVTYPKSRKVRKSRGAKAREKENEITAATTQLAK